MALGTRAISNGFGQDAWGGRNDDRQLGDGEEGAEQNESGATKKYSWRINNSNVINNMRV